MNNELINKMYKLALPLYKENHRVFHNEFHLNTGFYMLQRLLVNGEDVSDLQFAAWMFHDSIYSIESTENELNSANYFETLNQVENLGFSDDEVKIIKTIIMDTKSHIPSIDESKIILDVDMFILASKYEDFVEYRKKIKEEYSTHFSDEDIENGTKVFIETLLNQKTPIFHSDNFSDFENTARKNLQQYLDDFYV